MKQAPYLRRARLAIAFLALAGYATARYAGPNSPDLRLSAVLANKVLSMLAVGLMGLALAHPKPDLRKWAGKRAIASVGAHVLLSLALLAPVNYPRLFQGESFALLSEASLFAAALATILVLMVRGWGAVQRRVAQLAQALVAIHLLALGLPGWLCPSEWPRGLPPLTLLGCLYAIVTLACSLHDRAATPVRRSTTGQCRPALR